MKRHLVLTAALLATVSGSVLLAGCQSADTSMGARPAAVTFSNLQPVPVNLAFVDMFDKFDENAMQGDVTTQFVTSPTDALKAYAKQRFNAVGNSGALNFTILEASVTSRFVEPEDTITRAFELNEQAEYTITMRVAVDAVDRGAAGDIKSSFTQKRIKTLPAKISIAERERQLQSTLVNMIMALDGNIQQALATKGLIAAGGAPVSSSGIAAPANNGSGYGVPTGPASYGGGSITAQPLD